jgi:hypothetical protein
MECRAQVVELNGKKALVRVARVNCAECGACGILARDREHTMEFTVPDHLGVKEKDEVILRVPTSKLSLAYLTIFGMPVLAVAAVYLSVTVILELLGVGGVQGPGVVTAVAAGLVAFWGGIKLAEKLGLSPSMLEIVDRGVAGDVEEEVPHEVRNDPPPEKP